MSGGNFRTDCDRIHQCTQLEDFQNSFGISIAFGHMTQSAKAHVSEPMAAAFSRKEAGEGGAHDESGPMTLYTGASGTLEHCNCVYNTENSFGTAKGLPVPWCTGIPVDESLFFYRRSPRPPSSKSCVILIPDVTNK